MPSIGVVFGMILLTMPWTVIICKLVVWFIKRRRKDYNMEKFFTEDKNGAPSAVCLITIPTALASWFFIASAIL